MVDKYLKIMEWALSRYTSAAGKLVLSRGEALSRYTKIERAAWAKYKAAGALLEE